MRIVLTKISDERHRFEIERDDRSREGKELETRSFLLHDLLHYAVETEARLQTGFYGLLAQGTSLEQLNATGAMSGAMSNEDLGPPGSDLGVAEGVVGPMTAVIAGRAEPHALLEKMGLAASSTGSTLPSWFDLAFVLRVKESMRHLMGRWKAVPFRGQMELLWPPR
jgi:hypothetical protein